MQNLSPFVARVQRVFLTGQRRRFVRVTCPFCWQSHEHPWDLRDARPSREVVAPCAGPGQLMTYSIDPETAKQAAATAGRKIRAQVKAAKR